MKFSVLISVYGKERPEYFRQSLQSLLTQSRPVDEIVLVQDGPIPAGLQEVIESFVEKLPVRPVILPVNMGLSAALNKGLAACSHEWVARMDTDDICLPERFEETARYIEAHPSADIVGSFARRMDEQGASSDLMKVPVGKDRIRKLIWACPMIHPTVCYRKDKIMAIGGYNPSAGPRQDDYELWYRCAAAGYEFHNIPEVLLLYRFTAGNIRKNNLRVGYHRLKQGIKGNIKLGFGPIAYIGVLIPFIRALLPYPLNVWFYKALEKLNPRNK